MAEELLLLSLKDDEGTDQTWSGLDPGLAGALLLELVEDGALRPDDDGDLHPTAQRPSDPLLAEALDVIAESSKARSAKYWVGRLPGKLQPLRRRVAERLVERGILGEDSKQLLGVTVSRRYPEVDPEPERALRARLLAALTGDAEPAGRDAQLIALMRPFDLVAKNAPREQRKTIKRRAKEIAEGGAVAKAVGDEVLAVQMAIFASVATTAAATGGDGGGG